MQQVWRRVEVNSGFLWETPEGQKQLVIPRRRCDDNIKMDLSGSGLGAWTGSMTQDRSTWRTLVNEVMNLRVP